jgi:hypothetical protein
MTLQAQENKNLFKYIGNVITTENDLYAIYNYAENEKDKVLPAGSYLVLEKSPEDGSYWLYDIKNNENITLEMEFVPDDELEKFKIQSYYIQPEEIIQFYIDAVLKKIMELMADGWKIYPSDTPVSERYFDLTPLIEQLRVLKELKKILE